MVNVHNPRQCYVTLNWSRYLSLYQLGFGARGLGFRDSSQDVMGALAGAPVEARALLERDGYLLKELWSENRWAVDAQGNGVPTWDAEGKPGLHDLLLAYGEKLADAVGDSIILPDKALAKMRPGLRVEPGASLGCSVGE